MPLRTEDLGLTVRGRTLLQSVDLDLDGSGITAVIGPNGAGKSVLLKLLNGLLEPTAGRIRYGKDAFSAAHRERLALVFQKPVLLRRSVEANLAFACKAGQRDSDRVYAQLDRVGLLDKASQPARLLSGGESQRLALARALIREPEILFLDEACANLDPASVFAIEAIVCEAARAGTRIVMVTHDIPQARRLADEIVFLHQGELLEQRPADEFFAAPRSAAARAYLAGEILC